MIAMEEFHKFSLTHGLVLVVSVLLVGLVVLTSRRLRSKDPKHAEALRLWMGIAVLIFEILHNLYWLALREEGFDLKESLPLHICDVAGLIAAAALLFPSRRIVTILYFWGVGLSSLAFVIPVLTRGPAYVEFWTFWSSHLLIVGGSVFFVLAEGYRPKVRDLYFALAVTFAYIMLLLVIDIAIDANYGYVGKESEATGFLGTWPFPRIPLLIFGGVLLETAAWLPFGVMDWQRTRKAGRP